MIHKMYSLYEHIPQEIISAYGNEYDLALEPNPNLKVITLDFQKSGTEYRLTDSLISDYDSVRNTSDYFYRSAQGNTVSPFLCLYVTEDGLKEEKQYSCKAKDYKKFIKILQNNSSINNDLAGLRDYFSTQSESILEELLKYLRSEKAKPYLVTVRIDGLYIGQSPLFTSIKKTAAEDIYQDYYTLNDKIITGSNQSCSMCRSNQVELWGYVSVYNFYTSKTEFAPIAGGLNKELAHLNYPVCPDCAAKLKKMRPIVDKYFSFKFCGFDYLLIPEQIGQDPETMQLIIDIMVAQYNYEPGANLNIHTRLGDFSLGERKKLIDSYSKDVFDYLANTKDSVSYTMLFFKENKMQYKILMAVEDVFPSQFKAIYDAKGEAEKHDIFRGLPGKEKNEVYNLEFRFDTIKEFLPIEDRIEGDFSKAFLETTRSIFMGKQISFSYLLQRIMGLVRRRFTNDLNYELSMRKAFLLLKFLSYLGIIRTIKDYTIKEVTMSSKFVEFFEEHQDFFDSSSKQYIFMIGVLTQRLLNIQLRDKNSSPFRKRLNNLKLNKDIVHRIFTETIEKLEEYGKNYYRELEQDISALIVSGGIDKLSNDEISFYFTLGMTLYKKFKDNEIPEQED